MHRLGAKLPGQIHVAVLLASLSLTAPTASAPARTTIAPGRHARSAPLPQFIWWVIAWLIGSWTIVAGIKIGLLFIA